MLPNFFAHFMNQIQIFVRIPHWYRTSNNSIGILPGFPCPKFNWDELIICIFFFFCFFALTNKSIIKNFFFLFLLILVFVVWFSFWAYWVSWMWEQNPYKTSVKLMTTPIAILVQVIFYNCSICCQLSNNRL